MTWPPALARWIELPIRLSAIWRSELLSATTGGSMCASEVRMMMRSRLGLRLHHRDAALDQVIEVLVGEGKVETAGLDPGEVGEIIDNGDHPFAGGADVLHVFDVTLVAELAEPLADHHFGKTDDGVERRANFVADPRQHVGFRARRAIGLPRRRQRLVRTLAGLRKDPRNTAKKFGSSGRVRPILIDNWDHAALARAAEHVAAAIERARVVGGSWIVSRQSRIMALALRRKQVGEIALHEFGPVITEHRRGAAVASMDIAFGIEHRDALGRGVEDGAEFLGIRALSGGWPGDGNSFRDGRRVRSGKNQGQRRIAVP